MTLQKCKMKHFFRSGNKVMYLDRIEFRFILFFLEKRKSDFKKICSSHFIWIKIHRFKLNETGTKNEICVSLVYSGNGNKISFTFPLYTRETQISFFVPGMRKMRNNLLEEIDFFFRWGSSLKVPRKF
jgi:hypothetical protein